MNIQEQEELDYEFGASFGDPRRCPRHPGQVTSSNDGMHDCPCAVCEYEMEERESDEAEDQRVATRVAILVDDVAIGDGATEDEARADVDATCIPEGYEAHEQRAEAYDSRTHEVGMGPEGYVTLHAIHVPSAVTTVVADDDCLPF